MRTPTLPMILGLFFVILSGCTHLNLGNKSSEATKPVEKSSVTQEPQLTGPTAIWYLYSHDQVTLYLKNLDDGTPATMIIQKGLTRLPLPVGHWQVTGFEEGGESFTSMNTSKKFVFRVKPKANTYAGSIVIGCPKVGAEDFKHLKSMRFFNRYPFSSSTHLCEMIIGNDFAMVRSEFRKTQKTKGLSLTLGF